MKEVFIRVLFPKNCRDFLFRWPVGSQVAKKSPYIFRPQMCVVVFMTSATCPYPEPPQSTPPPQFPFLKYFNIILPTTTVSSKLSFSLWFLNQNPVCIPFYPTHPAFPAHPILRDFIIRIIGHSKPRSHILYNSSYTQQYSDYRYWSHSLWTAGGIRSHCLLKKVQLFTYCHHNPLRSDIAYGRFRRLRNQANEQCNEDLKDNLIGTEDLIKLFNLYGHKCILEMFLEFIRLTLHFVVP